VASGSDPLRLIERSPPPPPSTVPAAEPHAQISICHQWLQQRIPTLGWSADPPAIPRPFPRTVTQQSGGSEDHAGSFPSFGDTRAFPYRMRTNISDCCCDWHEIVLHASTSPCDQSPSTMPAQHPFAALVGNGGRPVICNGSNAACSHISVSQELGTAFRVARRSTDPRVCNPAENGIDHLMSEHAAADAYQIWCLYFHVTAAPCLCRLTQHSYTTKLNLLKFKFSSTTPDTLSCSSSGQAFATFPRPWHP
jgi:hypothetical protein